jgi:hypothetical protein
VKAETGSAPTTEPAERPQESRVPRWVVVIAALALVLGVVGVLIYGYLAKPGWLGAADKKFWDYLELLIVPTALAIGVAWLNWAQRQRERQAEEARRERELEVENQRAQDEALQAYLDQMGTLVLKEDLHDRWVRTLARARTVTVLARLKGPRRKRAVMRFLWELKLIQRIGGRDPIIDLQGADLRRTALFRAKLRGAKLYGAHLDDAELYDADLRGAILGFTTLRRVDLRDADLRGASLKDAVGISNDALEQQAYSLEGATMPNGQKYEDWIKSKGREENGENSGLS